MRTEWKLSDAQSLEVRRKLDEAETAIVLLGNVEVRMLGLAVRLSPLEAILVAAIAVQRNYSVGREELWEWLYPDWEDGKVTRDNVEAVLRSLRRKLGDFISTEGHAIQLKLRDVCVDLLEFQKAVSRGKNGETGAYAEAVGYYGGHLLEYLPQDTYDTKSGESRSQLRLIIEAARTKCRKELHVALDTLAQRDEEEGRLSSAVDWLEEAYADNPEDESVGLQLIRRLLRAGRRERAEAIRAELIENLSARRRTPSRTLQSILDVEIDDEPDETPRTTLRRTVGLGVRPEPLTRTVGRSEDVRRVREALCQPGLVTILGEPGIGKSRVAEQLARELSRAYEGGIDYFDLGNLETASIEYTIAQHVTLLGDDMDATAVLERHYKGRWSLLVLDGCERRAADIATLARRLLRASETLTLRILVTSRQPILAGIERPIRLDPLGTPEGDSVNLAAIQTYDAARLFLESGARHGYVASEADGPLITRICKRMGGLPLAIELASIWAEQLTLPVLLEKLDAAWDRIMDGPPIRDTDPERSLKTALETSWRMLSPHEQRLMYAVALFPAGARQPILGAVFETLFPQDCAKNGGQDFAVEGLPQLASKSLIRKRVGHSPASLRYSMLDPIRDFCLLRLGSEQLEQSKVAYSETYIQHGTKLVRTWISKGSRASDAGELEEEWENLWRAMEYAAHPRVLEFFKIVAPYCRASGRLPEFFCMTQPFLKSSWDEDTDWNEILDYYQMHLTRLAYSLFWPLDHHRAHKLVQNTTFPLQRVAAAASIALPRLSNLRAHHFGWLTGEYLVAAGHCDLTITLLDQILRWTRMEETNLLCRVLATMGLAHCGLGNPDFGCGWFDFGLKIAREQRDLNGWTMIAHQCTRVVLKANERGEAWAAEMAAEREEKLLTAVVPNLVLIGNAEVIPHLVRIGDLLLTVGRPQDALSSLREGLRVHQRYYRSITQGPVALFLARYAVREGNVVIARQILEAGRRCYPEMEWLLEYREIVAEVDNAEEGPAGPAEGGFPAEHLDTIVQLLLDDTSLSVSEAAHQVLGRTGVENPS